MQEDVMAPCREIRRQIEALATPAELPSRVREHLADCPACADAVAAARLASGLLRASPVVVAPSPGFADRVEARLARGTRPSTDAGELWRPAWGLVPTFAAILAALVVLQQGAGSPEPVSLVPTDGTSPAEQLFMAPGDLLSDTFLQAVLGEDGQ
jgi:anti-sigma factor RsiW